MRSYEKRDAYKIHFILFLNVFVIFDVYRQINYRDKTAEKFSLYILIPPAFHTRKNNQIKFLFTSSTCYLNRVLNYFHDAVNIFGKYGEK